MSPYVCIHKRTKWVHSLFIWGVFISHFKADALMLEVSNVLRYIACVKHCTMNKGSNAMYVKGVKSISKYTISNVMLCMSKVSKELQNGFTHLYSILS